MERYILEAALKGLESEQEKIAAYIQDVKVTLGMSDGKRVGRPKHTESDLASVLGEQTGQHTHRKASGRTEKRRRVLTPEAKNKIAMAQRRRWEKFRSIHSTPNPNVESEVSAAPEATHPAHSAAAMTQEAASA